MRCAGFCPDPWAEAPNVRGASQRCGASAPGQMEGTGVGRIFSLRVRSLVDQGMGDPPGGRMGPEAPGRGAPGPRLRGWAQAPAREEPSNRGSSRLLCSPLRSTARKRLGRAQRGRALRGHLRAPTHGPATPRLTGPFLSPLRSCLGDREGHSSGTVVHPHPLALPSSSLTHHLLQEAFRDLSTSSTSPSLSWG